MAKFSFKRPRIISKKFQEVDSTIDGVTKSLHDLVFSYTERIDKSLQKKHVMMAISSLVLLIVLGSFISPNGKAESSVFYPDTCLGGWVNPQYAQGEQQTTSNGDESQFTKDNSAVLPKNTPAEMYCGNFRGKFDSATLPTKIIVSLALTKGADLSLEDTLESGIIATSSPEEIETVSTTTLDLLEASTTPEYSSSTENSDTTSSTTTENNASTTQEEATSTPVISPQEPPSIVDGIIESVKDTLDVLLDIQIPDKPVVTDTIIIPQPSPVEVQPLPEAPTPEVQSEPTSRAPSLYEKIFSLLFVKVFAQEDGETTSSTPLLPPEESAGNSSAPTSTEVAEELPVVQEEIVSPQAQPVEPATLLEALISGIGEVSSSTEEITPETYATTTEEIATTTPETYATTTEETQFQDNFLEIFYTFDGVTWVSLGALNEISMKYRTFEIPVTASTSWSDMSRLQIKVVAKKHTEDTPTVYLDAIKVEVLYSSTLLHAHPDFARDTILQDETIDDMRIVTIINNETNQEEIWYMYLDEATTTIEIATSTDVVASSTITSSTTVSEIVLPQGTSTLNEATTTATTTLPTIKPVRQKNVWIKFEGVKEDAPTGQRLRELILLEEKKKEKYEEEEKQKQPDFSLDTIKKIKGALRHIVIVQLEKDGHEELWLYDLEKETQEKISNGSSTSLSTDSPLGVKEDYLFWVSEDKTKIFAYNMITKEIKEQVTPTYDVSKGERGEVTFENIPWKVIVGTEEFFFWSEQTGEVFSDDNGSIAGEFRTTLKLDTVLNKENLSNLNFQVEETKTDE